MNYPIIEEDVQSHKIHTPNIPKVSKIIKKKDVPLQSNHSFKNYTYHHDITCILMTPKPFLFHSTQLSTANILPSPRYNSDTLPSPDTLDNNPCDSGRGGRETWLARRFIFPRSENNYRSVACDNSSVMSL